MKDINNLSAFTQHWDLQSEESWDRWKQLSFRNRESNEGKYQECGLGCEGGEAAQRLYALAGLLLYFRLLARPDQTRPPE